MSSKISALTESFWNTANIVSNELILAYSGANYRMKLSELKKLIFGSATREIGGTDGEDLVTVSGSQIMTNKDLTNPKINGVNTGTFVTGANVGFLQNLSTNVQAAITSFTASIASLLLSTAESDILAARKESIVYSYRLEDFTGGGSTTKTIAASTLITSLGSSASGFSVISPISISVYSKSTLNTYHQFDDTVGLRYSRTGGDINTIDEITLTNLSTVAGMSYSAYITFSITDNP